MKFLYAQSPTMQRLINLILLDYSTVPLFWSYANRKPKGKPVELKFSLSFGFSKFKNLELERSNQYDAG